MTYQAPQDPFMTSPGNDAPRRTSRRWMFAAIGVLLLLAAGGTYAGWTVAGEPTALTSPSPSPTVRDPGGKKACDDAEYAMQYKAWDNYQLALNMIEAAKTSSNKAITNMAVILELQLAVVAASQNEPDKLPERHRKLHDIVQDLERLCRHEGLL